MSEFKMRIGVTQGDTNGIGWEVILKTFSNPAMAELCTPVIYGNLGAAKYYTSCIEEMDPIQFSLCHSAREARRGKVNLVEVGEKELPVEPGKETESAAKAALAALEAAADDLAEGLIDAVVTAPISKAAMQSIGFGFTGHTEFFAAKCPGEPMMIMCSELMRVALQTIHIQVSDVASQLTTEAIEKSVKALRDTVKRDFGVVEPRIAVLALNPHAGDEGLLGTEEQTIIKPAVENCFRDGVLVYGPLSADGLFASSAFRKYDAILAMYHDQGLAPFKALCPDGVNFTAGLDKVRTSPDHGTAFDIAGKGVADAQSMRNAVYMAMDIVRNRNAYARWSSNPLQRFERDNGKDVSVKDLPDTTPKDL